MIRNKFKIIDIGHSNFNQEKAIIILETEISQSLYDKDCRAVKIITGHGSGILKKAVKEWIKDQEGRFKAVIYGKEYNLFNKIALDMRLECQIKNDLDFGRNNSGVVYVWFW